MTNIYREPVEWCDMWIRSADRSGRRRILCIGDSICRGYEPHVDKQLSGQFSLSRLATSRFVCDPVYFQQLSLLLDQCRFALIHVNNGLHGWDHDEADYQDGIDVLIDYLRRRTPETAIVWANSTPVRQVGDLRLFDQRHDRVVLRNEIASRIMLRRGVPVNDLFSLALANPEWTSEDGIHYTADGYRGLAAQVSECICAGMRRHSSSLE
jgi:lysophospholipase L1-like esterase